MNTPKKLNPAAFAALAVTQALGRALPPEALEGFLDSMTVWKGLLAELQRYAGPEADALAAIRPDELLTLHLGAEKAAALTVDKRRELRGRIHAEAAGRAKTTAALLHLITNQVASGTNAGPAYRAAYEAREAEYLGNPIEA